jgi:hypothetical protein
MYNVDVKKEELKPIYSTRQSFYKKAYFEIVSEWNETHAKIHKIKLYSYNTLVCTIEYFNQFDRMYYIHLGELSQTTTRHIREFLLQWLYCKEKTLTKKDILKNRCIKYNVVDDNFINLPY